jgi:hypothetical protein
MREHNVALFEKGDRHFNTLVAAVDLVFPLEADLDGDPEQDDEVRLKSVAGHYVASLHAHDDAVELHPETALLLYRFEDVPKGVYTLEVRIGSRWSALLYEIEIRKDGVYVAGHRYDTTIDEIHAGIPHEKETAEEPPDSDDDLYRDQPEEASRDPREEAS